MLSYLFNHVPANVVTELLQDRVFNNFKNNWRKHTLRSYSEIALWLHCTSVIFEKTGGNVWDALLLGMTSGFFIVVILHFVMMFGKRAFGVSNASFLSDKQVVLFLALFVVARQLHYGDGLYMSTITFTGVVLLTFVRMLAIGHDVSKESHVFRDVMTDRLFNAKRNWIEKPVRTVVELSLLLLSFVCAYAVVGDLLASLVVGGASGVEYCILHMQYVKEKQSSTALLTGFGLSLLVLVLIVYILKEILPDRIVCFDSHALHCENRGIAHFIPIVWICFLGFGIVNADRNWELSRNMGAFVLSKWKNIVQHWKAQPLRSFIEIFLWLHLIDCVSRATSKASSLPVVCLIGLVSAYIVFYLVQFSRILIRNIESLSGVQKKRPRFSSATGVDGPLLNDRALALFLVLYTISRKVFTTTNAVPTSTSSSSVVVLVTLLFGIVTLTLVRLVSKTRAENVFGTVVQDRIINARLNFRKYPVRTTVENVFWILLFVVAYLILDDVLSAGVVGFSCGIGYSVMMTKLPKSFRKFVLRNFRPSVPEDVVKRKELIVSKDETKTVFKCPGTRNFAVIENSTLESEQKLIQIDGKMYDVAKFAPRHPGGSVILEFVGKDASTIFSVFHAKRTYKLLKMLEVKTEKSFKTILNDDEAEKDFRELVDELHEGGYFEPDHVFLFKKICVTLGLLLFTVLGVVSGRVPIYLCAISLGLMWKQSAYIVHDEMHLQCLQDRKYDQVVGFIFGNILLGASSVWWVRKIFYWMFTLTHVCTCSFNLFREPQTEEHFPHHVHTNTIIETVGSGDPQQREEIFCQSESLRPFIPNIACKLLVKLQNILFVPILILFGRFGLCGASYTMQRGTREHLGVALHWIWVLALLYQCDSLFDAVSLWIIGAIIQGLLGLFLCLGHYDKDFVEKSASMKMSWLRRQIAVTKDVDASYLFDWFYGGPNLHTVHHLLPRLCRSKYREVDVKLRELYAKHDIKIDRVPFSQALYDVLTHMKKESWRESWREIFMSG